jgi:hypothetical protein
VSVGHVDSADGVVGPVGDQEGAAPDSEGAWFVEAGCCPRPVHQSGTPGTRQSSNLVGVARYAPDLVVAFVRHIDVLSLVCCNAGGQLERRLLPPPVGCSQLSMSLPLSMSLHVVAFCLRGHSQRSERVSLSLSLSLSLSPSLSLPLSQTLTHPFDTVGNVQFHSHKIILQKNVPLYINFALTTILFCKTTKICSFVETNGMKPTMEDIRLDSTWEAVRQECMRIELKLARHKVRTYPHMKCAMCFSCFCRQERIVGTESNWYLFACCSLQEEASRPDCLAGALPHKPENGPVSRHSVL